MLFVEYLTDELNRADMTNESIVRVGPDIRHGQYRNSHLETNRHDTRIQHYKNGNYIEKKMDATEKRNRHLAQDKLAQKKRNAKMGQIQRKRRLAMMRRRIMNMKQQPDVKTGGKA